MKDLLLTLQSRLRPWFDGLSAREQRMVAWAGVAIAALIFFGGGVLPLYETASKAAQRVEQKQKDLSWMRSVADELRAAGPAATRAMSGRSLIVVVDQTAQQAGLGTALSGSQPSGTGGIRVRIEGAAFDNVVAWLALLEQQQQVTVESATIDRGPQAGVVNASIALKKSG
jgi:general secretion pathway protein M